MSLHERIERDFTYHSPLSGSIDAFKLIRSTAKSLALLIDIEVPDSREKSMALTHLEEAVMWANAGIVRNQNA